LWCHRKIRSSNKNRMKTQSLLRLRELTVTILLKLVLRGMTYFLRTTIVKETPSLTKVLILTIATKPSSKLEVAQVATELTLIA
jgi:hypothetical protein